MRQDENGYSGLADLSDGFGNRINLSDFAKTPANQGKKDQVKSVPKPKLPDTYKGKDWDELYRTNELETIRNEYPEHYESLKKEKFNKD